MFCVLLSFFCLSIIFFIMLSLWLSLICVLISSSISSEQSLIMTWFYVMYLIYLHMASGVHVVFSVTFNLELKINAQ